MGMSTTSTSPQEDVTRRLQALSDLLKAAATDDNVHLKKETERCKRVVEQDLPPDLPETAQEWDDDIIALTKQLMECRQDTPEKMEIEDKQPARVTYKPERRSRRPKEEKRKSKTTKEEEPQDRREHLQREMSEMSYPKIGKNQNFHVWFCPRSKCVDTNNLFSFISQALGIVIPFQSCRIFPFQQWLRIYMYRKRNITRTCLRLHFSSTVE